MSLENLSKIGLLEAHTTDAQQLGKLLDAAQRCIDSESVEECIKAAQRLRQQVVAWLKSNVPDLIK